ncbi:RE2 [Symbiodinium sp. CCMP2592]|nr:RE2 [Symbiodinium sp. CCMP2592]
MDGKVYGVLEIYGLEGSTGSGPGFGQPGYSSHPTEGVKDYIIDNVATTRILTTGESTTSGCISATSSRFVDKSASWYGSNTFVWPSRFDENEEIATGISAAIWQLEEYKARQQQQVETTANPDAYAISENDLTGSLARRRRDAIVQGNALFYIVGKVTNVTASATETSASSVDIKDVLADVGKVLKAMQATTIKTMKVTNGQSPHDKQKIVKEIQVEMPKKSGLEPSNKQKIVEEIHVEMPKKSGLVISELQRIAEEIQVRMLKKSGTSDKGLESVLKGILAKDNEGSPDGLLDSGASHPMRSAPTSEYESGSPVSVTLAGEDVKVLRQNRQGTILVEEEQGPVQSIVPLGAIIQELGYTLHWGPKHLKLAHPEKGPIRVKVNNNCPEVAACDALALIRELEMKQVKELTSSVNTLRARLEVLKLEEKRDWTELLKEYMSDGQRSTLLKALMKCPFTKGLPSEVQSMLLEDFNLKDGEKYLRNLPLTRRKRRALLTSSNWVVSLFMGEKDAKDPFKMVPMAGKILLEVDMKYSKLWDFNKGLSPLQQQRAHQETAYAVKQMLVWTMATMKGQGNIGFLMELPADPEWHMETEYPYSTFWRTELWKSFKSVSGMCTASFNMGAYGHRTKRPTKVGTNYPAIIQMEGNYDFNDQCVPPSLLTRSTTRQWSDGFKKIVMESLSDFHEGLIAEEEALADLGVKLTKLTKEQREGWRNHLLNDHQPYRADCAVCINAQANGYQHRRRRHPHLYTVALDVAGPYATKGRDMENEDYKYMLIAAYRCPRDYMSMKALSEEERELYVPDEDEAGEGGPEDPFVLEEEDSLEKESVEPTSEEEDKPMGPITLDEEVENLTKKIEIEFTSRKLLSEKNYDLNEVVNLFYKLEELGDTDFRVGKKVAKQFAGKEKFTAVGVVRNSMLGMHRDIHNYKKSMNIAVPLTTFKGGGLWQHDPEIEEELGIPKYLPNGQLLKGKIQEAKRGEPILFSPSTWHEVQPWEGERVMLLMYTPRATKLKEGELNLLREHGFEVDPGALHKEEEDHDVQPEDNARLSALRVNDLHTTTAFFEFNDFEDASIEQVLPSTATTRMQEISLKREAGAVLKKAEVQYTSNIEEILKECVKKKQPLDVTHTVSLQDVKRNLEAWKASAVKEYENLKNNKRAFVVKKRHELPPGCQIIPCKGVFTTKPDKNEFFRRKTRFVGCGNHIPDGQEDMDLFATGIDATSLRTMIAFSIDKPWQFGTTDIRQAFVLAPWRGQRVALQPPQIAYELGLAEVGDYWLVEMALYGLRQSPALWSQFRDEQLSMARFTAKIDGREEELRVVQMVADNQIWKIVRCNGDQEPLGFVMVYIDDLLVKALPEAMDAFYQWVAARWECDGLDVLREGNKVVVPQGFVRANYAGRYVSSANNTNNDNAVFLIK